MRPSSPSSSATLACALAALVTLSAATARAQREGFDGAAARQHSKIEQDRALDLNNDGTIDDHEVELAIQNAMQQNFVGPDGKVDKEKLRAAKVQRKRLLAEARILDAEAELLEKKAKGKKLSAKDEEQLRLAAEIHEREKRERAAAAAAKTTQSAASQRLSKPIIEY